MSQEEKMMGVIENLESNLRQIRTGRASGQMLERVQVEYYGAMTPINQMAQISVVEGTQLVIKPYDRSIIKDIAHAIQAANLGLNPQAEADVIRIQVPQLTELRTQMKARIPAHVHGTCSSVLSVPPKSINSMDTVVKILAYTYSTTA